MNSMKYIRNTVYTLYVFDMSTGTLMELGISPIVTSGLIMQVSSYLIDVVIVMMSTPFG